MSLRSGSLGKLWKSRQELEDQEDKALRRLGRKEKHRPYMNVKDLQQSVVDTGMMVGAPFNYAVLMHKKVLQENCHATSSQKSPSEVCKTTSG